MRDLIDKRVLVLQALANDYRLMLVERLAAGRTSVGDLCEALGGALPGTVSQHLKVLRDSGVVVGTGAGPWRYYCLVDRVNVERILNAAGRLTSREWADFEAKVKVLKRNRRVGLAKRKEATVAKAKALEMEERAKKSNSGRRKKPQSREAPGGRNRKSRSRGRMKRGD